MLGYTEKNNDVYIFFENNEIERLKTEKIQGLYLTVKDLSRAGLLEASINDEISDPVRASSKRDEFGVWTHVLVEIRSRDYERFIEKGFFETHEGYRHICLRDASRLDDLGVFDHFNYGQLRDWRDKYLQDGKK